jgi:hypothetical protein
LPPEQKDALKKKWRQYQSLPKSERDALRRKDPDTFDGFED